VTGLGDGIGSQEGDHAPGDQHNADHGGADHRGGATAATHPGSEPGDPVLGALGREHVAEQWYFDEDLLHETEEEDQQNGRDGSWVELVDVIQRVEVGDAG
jgi:hypothetical protein